MLRRLPPADPRPVVRNDGDHDDDDIDDDGDVDVDAGSIERLRAMLRSPRGDDAEPPGPPDRQPGAWRRILAARWSLPTAAGVAAVALLAAVAVVLVLRASMTAPGLASSDSARSSAGMAVIVPRAAAAASASSVAGAAPLMVPGVTAVAAPVGSSPTAAAGDLVVDVVGRVASPGLLHLPVGSRVDDAVQAAGGSRGADLDLINLARPLVDGEQLVVPAPGQSVAPVAAPAPTPAARAGSGSGAAATPVAPVSLRTATAAQLDTLPGIGPVLAQRIVDWRTAHGPFATVDDVNQVSGIGDVLMGRLRPFLTP